MTTATQVFLNQLGRSTMNLKAWDNRSFELNYDGKDELVSPQLTDSEWNDFMLDNPSVAVNGMGQLVDANYNVLGIAIERTHYYSPPEK